MNKNLPDKWIRKAVYDAINNISVDNNTRNDRISDVLVNPFFDASSSAVRGTTNIDASADMQMSWNWLGNESMASPRVRNSGPFGKWSSHLGIIPLE